MNIETTLVNGTMRRWGFVDLPELGRVPIDLAALSDAGWANQMLAYPQIDARVKAEIRAAALLAAGQTPVEPPPIEPAPNPMVAWEREMRRLDAALLNDARYWEEFVQGAVSAFAQARMDNRIAEREAHRQARPIG